MGYTYKQWNFDDIYNFNVEFNRIESYNEYCQSWLNNYFGISIIIENKTDWTIKDIVDLQDYNRVKNNINIILDTINSSISRLTTSQQVNQVFNIDKANELEIRLKDYLIYLGEMQFLYNISGLTNCGNSLKLNGVL